MSSKRIYITLNDKKEKDKIILEYLNSCYSESDAIKECLYQIATSRYNKIHLGANSYNIDQKGINYEERVVKDINSTEKVQIDSKKDDFKKDILGIKRDNEVQIGAKDSGKLKDINSTEKVQIDAERIKKEKEDAERLKKEKEQLFAFM